MSLNLKKSINGMYFQTKFLSAIICVYRPTGIPNENANKKTSFQMPLFRTKRIKVGNKIYRPVEITKWGLTK
jgi:hypothetical protein